MNQGNGHGEVVDIQVSAARNAARVKFIKRLSDLRDETASLVNSIKANPDAFKPPLGQWMSLMQLQLLRAQNWANELLMFFQTSEYAKDVPSPVVRDLAPIDLSPDGIAHLKQMLQSLNDRTLDEIDWMFLTSAYQEVWVTKRTDQIWQAMSEALQWVDHAIETVHSLQQKEQQP